MLCSSLPRGPQALRGQVSVLLMLESLEIAGLGLESNCLPASHCSAVTSIELMVRVIGFNSFLTCVFQKHILTVLRAY